eukprot:TRINITY_DN19176_c0_g1_i1.p1 TRINITY_DN19176_c0_g1~~TRINITY_DN19176_c0_g1_i1.p1  ORF type:complete len:1526 (-),score=347.64 TRINITY_DN19176_c0_g1_i1:60-4616(-)
MVAEYKLFQPSCGNKDVDDATWKNELKEKSSSLDALMKAGEKSREDLELFLEELIWATLRGELSAKRCSELLVETSLTASEGLQKLLADVLWMVSFVATESPASREMREDFSNLCIQLEQKEVLSKSVLAASLELESVPVSLCQVQLLRKKQNQAKTKARYTITRFNLLREHSEGYAKLLLLLDRLSSLEFEPPATAEQIAQSKEVLIEDIVRLIGFSNLCPNRIIAMTIDIYEQRLSESDPCPLAEPLVDLLRRFPRKRLTKVVVFQLLAHGPAPAAGKQEGKPVPQPVAPTRPSQFLAVASLVALGLVDLDVVWSYLDPSDASIQKTSSELTAKYEEELVNISKVDLGGTASKDTDAFNKAYQAFNQAGHQKFRFAAALVSVNDWRSAHKVLCHLSKLCKPALNHYIRTALCDLLKWIIQPLLRPSQQRLPHSGKPTLESTFSGMRRFGLRLGLGQEGGEQQVPACLKQVTEASQLLTQAKHVLDQLGYFMHTDVHLLASFWKVLGLTLRKPGNNNAVATSAAGAAQLEDGLVAVVYRNLLPAASLVPHNSYLSDLMWSVMSQLSVFQRFMIYSCWENMYGNFLLKFAYEKTKVSTKQVLKRVVANAERKDLIAQMAHFHLCKLCHSNPIPTIEIMMKDVEIGFNVNMIQPYVECTNKCPEMTADIMGFVLSRICARPVTEVRPFLNQGDATVSPWLTNIAEFAGRFYKKHSQTDLVGLLTIITKRINSEVPELNSKDSFGPKEYKGESLIRVVLENLLEYMGGYVSVRDLTADQLICLAGGPRLRTESVAYGKREDQSRKEKARKALFEAIVDLGLVQVLWHSLSAQRLHFLSEDFSEAHGGSAGLKLLGLLFDGNHDCFLKLTEFLAQSCNREKYMSLLPSFQDIFATFEPAMAFLVVRHGLLPFGRGKVPVPKAAAAVSDKTKNGQAGSAEETRTQEKLEQVIRLYQLQSFEDDGLAMQFYITFWRLSLQDIFMPTEGYERSIGQINAAQKQIETQRFKMERDRDYAHSREYKNLKKESARLKDFHDKLKEEQLQQKLNHEKVLARLETEKVGWFKKPGPSATACFVAEMLCPRVLTSYADALFCCRFVRLLIRLKTPGFQLLDFYNSWTVMLTQNIRCCSEREAQIFGVFLREMMAYVYNLRKNEKTYEAEMKDNPCFHRHYAKFEDKETIDKDVVEYAKYEDIKKGHAKWEGRIYKALRQNLDSEDWMEKRNALLLLSQSCEAFPVVAKYATLLLQCVESMRDKEEASDLKTLANSLTIKLKAGQNNWVDKTETSATAQSKAAAKDAKDKAAEKSSKEGKTEEVRKVSIGAKNPLAPSATKEPATTVKESADAKGSPEANGNGTGEKRTREDDKKVDGGSEARESKHHKDQKESKEAKGKDRDRAEPKASKEVKDTRSSEKDSKRSSERTREKDRDRAKSSSAPEKDENWKRSAGSSSVPAVSSVDERPEKRRRSERVDRHADRSSARNALVAPESSSHDHSSRRSQGTHASSGGQGGGGSSRHDGHRGRR